jgi:adhesin/invasin
LIGSPVTFTATGTAGAATQIAVSGGDGQSSTVGTAVTTAPSVIVRDVLNNPVPGVSVTFAVATGGGAVVPPTALITDASGIAQVASWTLGTSAGSNTLTATSGTLVGSPVTFTATGTAGAAAQMALHLGDGQSAPVGTAVAVPPSVLVTDAHGNPVAGVSVTFAVTGGGGSLTGETATTDASGIATVGSWTLGTTAGSNTLTATSGSLTGSPVTFTATGTAGAAVQIAVAAGDGQTATAGMAVGTPPEVLVTDVYGNPVSGVSVTFAVASGDGAVDPTTAVVTGSNGIASVTSWTLGPVVGTNTLTATATGTGITGNPVTFTATGT